MPPSYGDAAIGYPGLSRGVRDALADPSFRLSSPPTMSTPKRSRIWHGAWLPGSSLANPAREARAPGRGYNPDLFDCN
jgi:hypothetical protein